MDTFGSVLRDFGYGGLALATFYYLVRSIYALSTQRNGNRPKNLTDLHTVLVDHAKEETEHHERVERQNDRLLESMSLIEGNLMRLLGRGERL